MWPKIENTLEFKAKFYTLYWGQEICVWPELENLKEIRTKVLSELDENDYIILTSVDDITDEHLEVCYHLHNAHIGYDGTMDFGSHLEMVKYWIDMSKGYKDLYNTPSIVDYLRSKGYALPYLTLSVEEQVSYGWIKLKKKHLKIS